MSDLTIYEAIINAISSLASESGRPPVAERESPTTIRCGRALAPASLSARQAEGMGLLTSGTFGRTGSGSFLNADRASSMESKLRRRTALLGSTLYRLTWKERATPDGLPISALRASVPRTSGSVSSSSLNTHTHRRLGEPERSRLERYPRHGDETSGWTIEAGSVATTGATRRVDYTFSLGRGARRHDDAEYDRIVADANHLARRLADADLIGPGEEGIQRSGEFVGLGRDPRHSNGDARCPGPVNGFWSDADWLRCRDERWRPVEPGTFPLAPSDPSRLGRLRAYGNAINLEVATEFIRSHRDALAYRGLHRSSADIV